LILSSGKVLAMGTLQELRNKADLPVAIKPSGLNGAVLEDIKLNGFFCKNEGNLQVPENKKMTVLKQLLSYENLTDIEVEAASLERLYQHYLTLNSEQSAKEAEK